MFLIGKSDLAYNNFIVLDNIVFCDVNLLHSQIFIDLFWVVEVLCVADDLSLYKQPQTVCVENRKAENTHQ